MNKKILFLIWTVLFTLSGCEKKSDALVDRDNSSVFGQCNSHYAKSHELYYKGMANQITAQTFNQRKKTKR